MVSPLDAQAVDEYLANPVDAWQNPNDPFDVYADGQVNPADALAIINELNGYGEHLLTGQPGSGAFYLDVSGDRVVSELDVDDVIDKLNQGTGQLSRQGRNTTNPFDVNSNGVVDTTDKQAILDLLTLGRVNYGPVSLDEVHVRMHGGDDIADITDAPAWLFGGSGDDWLLGSQFGNYMDGGDGNDNISADPYGYLYHRVSDDALMGGPGDDNIGGGGGNDTIDAGEGNNSINAINYSTTDIGHSTITVGDGNNLICAGSDPNILQPRNDSFTITAGNGNNTIYTGNGGDVVTAGDGNNIVHAGNGGETITAGNGSNTIYGGNGGDTITVGKGAAPRDPAIHVENLIYGGNGYNSIFVGDAGSASNTLNTIYGGNGGNLIETGDANSVVQGGDGGDSIWVGNGDDTIDGGDGGNFISAGSGNNTIQGGNGGDVITVGDGNNSITGGTGDDIIYTGNGRDVVDGGGGNDQIGNPNTNPSPISLAVDPPGDISADTHQAVIAVTFSSAFLAAPLLSLNGPDVTFAISDGSTTTTRTAPIQNGAAAIVLDTSTVSGTQYTISAWVATLSGSAAFSVVPGEPYAISLSKSKNALIADTSDSMTLQATIQDQYGNLVADGTPVAWLSANGGNVFTDGSSPDDFDAEIGPVGGSTSGNNNDVGGVTTGGHASITVRAPAVPSAATDDDAFTITLDAGAATASVPIEVTPITIQISGPSELDANPTLPFNPNALEVVVTTNAPNGTHVEWTGPQGFLGVDSVFSTETTVVNGASKLDLANTDFFKYGNWGWNIGPAVVTATIGHAMAVHSFTVTSSYPYYAQLDHPIIAGDATADGTDTITVPNTQPMVDADTDLVFGTPDPALARTSTYNYFAEATLTVHGAPNSTASLELGFLKFTYIEVLNPATDLPTTYITLNASGVGTFLIRSKGALPGGDQDVPVSAYLVVKVQTTSGFADEEAKLGITQHNWWTRSLDAGLSFIGGDPQTAAGVAANAAGGMLVVGDVGALVKNYWRAIGFSDKPVNYAEVTLSGLGLATELAVGVGEAADAPISGVRAIVAAIGKTKFTDALIILLKRALTNAQDIVKFGKLVAKITTSEAAFQIAQKLFTSDEALQAGIRGVEQFGDNFFPVLANVGDTFSKKAAERLNSVLGNLSTTASNTFKQLSGTQLLAATSSIGLMLYRKKVDPAVLIKVLNNLPFQIASSPTKLVALLSDMGAVVDVNGFAKAINGIVTIANSAADATTKATLIYGRLYEFRVASYLKQQGKSVGFIDEFVKAAKELGLTATDIDVVAEGVYYQAKSSTSAFKTLDDVMNWVAKAKEHARVNGIIPPVIKYVVPNLDIVPADIKAWLADELIDIIPVAF
jgi:Ca2+-binding RTX toxin-like protein